MGLDLDMGGDGPGKSIERMGRCRVVKENGGAVSTYTVFICGEKLILSLCTGIIKRKKYQI